LQRLEALQEGQMAILLTAQHMTSVTGLEYLERAQTLPVCQASSPFLRWHVGCQPNCYLAMGASCQRLDIPSLKTLVGAGVFKVWVTEAQAMLRRAMCVLVLSSASPQRWEMVVS
jgi:hypothetical protein